MPVVIDPMLFEHRLVTFAAGTTSESIEAPADEVFTGASVTIAPITRRPSEADALRP